MVFQVWYSADSLDYAVVRYTLQHIVTETQNIENNVTLVKKGKLKKRRRKEKMHQWKTAKQMTLDCVPKGVRGLK